LIAVAVKNKVEVRIGGKDYTLVGVESDEYIQKVSLYIDKKMNEVLKLNSKLSTSLAAVLTAINVADDYLKAHESEYNGKKELKHLYGELEKYKAENRRLNEEIDRLSNQSTGLQLQLAKREAELGEVRNSYEKVSRQRGA
jgi:cell division protein ZapA